MSLENDSPQGIFAGRTFPDFVNFFTNAKTQFLHSMVGFRHIADPEADDELIFKIITEEALVVANYRFILEAFLQYCEDAHIREIISGLMSNMDELADVVLGKSEQETRSAISNNRAKYCQVIDDITLGYANLCEELITN